MACQEWRSHGAVLEEPSQIRMMVSGPSTCGASYREGASEQNVENNPMQSSRLPPASDAAT